MQQAPYICSVRLDGALGRRRRQHVVDLAGQGALVGLVAQASLCDDAQGLPSTVVVGEVARFFNMKLRRLQGSQQ